MERANPTPTPIDMRSVAKVWVESGARPRRQFVYAGVRGDKRGEPFPLKITAAAILHSVTGKERETDERMDASRRGGDAHVFAVPPTKHITASQKAKQWLPSEPCDVQPSIAARARLKREVTARGSAAMPLVQAADDAGIATNQVHAASTSRRVVQVALVK